jgi:hypothetical protein
VRDLRRARTDVQGDRQRARRRLGKLGLRHGWSYQEGWTVGLERWLNLLAFAEPARRPPRPLSGCGRSPQRRAGHVNDVARHL